MEVRLIEEDGRRSIEVRVLGAPGDERARMLARRIRSLGGRVHGYAGPGSAERRVADLADVAYFEVEGDHAVIRLRSGEDLDSPLRLFEVEAMLVDTEFIRVSRQVVVNFELVRSIRPEAGGRLLLALEGGDSVLVTRTYVGAIRQKLGIGA